MANQSFQAVHKTSGGSWLRLASWVLAGCAGLAGTGWAGQAGPPSAAQKPAPAAVKNAPATQRAKYSPPPQTYSITQITSTRVFALGIDTETVRMYRDGPKFLIDTSRPPRAETKGFGARFLYDLQAHRSWTWDLIDTSRPCEAATFSGYWGDPFALSTATTANLGKQHARELGTETVNGMATRVLEMADPEGKGKQKLWLDAKYGLIIKQDEIAENGQHQTMLEVKQLSLAKPPASVFALPPACANAPITGHTVATLGPGGEITSHATAHFGEEGRRGASVGGKATMPPKPVRAPKNEEKTTPPVAGRRDPFKLPVVMTGGGEAGAAAGGPVGSLPPGNRGLVVSQLQLEGIVRLDTNNAMIAVVTNNRKLAYFLKTDDVLYDGVVSKITPDAVYFKENHLDPNGRVMTVEVVKRLSPAPGEVK